MEAAKDVQVDRKSPRPCAAIVSSHPDLQGSASAESEKLSGTMHSRGKACRNFRDPGISFAFASGFAFANGPGGAVAFLGEAPDQTLFLA
jgi:hypothetical protein